MRTYKNMPFVIMREQFLPKDTPCRANGGLLAQTGTQTLVRGPGRGLRHLSEDLSGDSDTCQRTWQGTQTLVRRLLKGLRQLLND